MKCGKMKICRRDSMPARCAMCFGKTAHSANHGHLTWNTDEGMDWRSYLMVKFMRSQRFTGVECLW